MGGKWDAHAFLDASVPRPNRREKRVRPWPSLQTVTAGRVTDGARMVVDSLKHYQARERSTLSGATLSTRRVPR